MTSPSELVEEARKISENIIKYINFPLSYNEKRDAAVCLSALASALAVQQGGEANLFSPVLDDDDRMELARLRGVSFDEVEDRRMPELERMESSSSSPTVQQGDTERLDWLEKNKGPGKGGWEVLGPQNGWGLRITPRGRFNSLRRAIDAAMKASHSIIARPETGEG